MSLSFSIFIFCLSLLGGIFVTGFGGFFVGLSVSPLSTLATQFGISLVPFVVGLFMAKVLSLFIKKISLNVVWSCCTVVIIVLMAIGVSTKNDNLNMSSIDNNIIKECHLWWDGKNFIKSDRKEQEGFIAVQFTSTTSVILMPERMQAKAIKEIILNEKSKILKICPNITFD